VIEITWNSPPARHATAQCAWTVTGTATAITAGSSYAGAIVLTVA
jgi:hypothetical protein